METLYKGKRAYVWKISKTVKQPKWIEDLFSKHYLIWYDDTLKILVSSINPNSDRNIKLGLRDILKDNYGGRHKLGNIGYFFDAANGRIISKKKFNSQ